MKKSELRQTVRGYYDTQKLRIQTGGRVIANFKALLGQEPGEKEEVLEAKEKGVLASLRNEYNKITEGAANFPKRRGFKGTALISEYTDLVMIGNFNDLIQIENRMYKEIEVVLEGFPVYTEYLKNIKGCGIAMSGVIISEINIALDQQEEWKEIGKKLYVSSLWANIGIDVAKDGKGRSKRKEHLVLRSYIDKKGNEKERLSITFNPFLKSKLLGVLGPSFLKTQNVPYSDIYYAYKNRLLHHEKYKDVSLGHRHNMAIRYMIKMFIKDLYLNWRELEGLPISKPYAEAKLGIRHEDSAAFFEDSAAFFIANPDAIVGIEQKERV